MFHFLFYRLLICSDGWLLAKVGHMVRGRPVGRPRHLQRIRRYWLGCP